MQRVPSSDFALPPPSERPRPNLLHALVLAAVFLAVASSGVVFTEPAPVDVLTMGLVIALPLLGLVRANGMLVGYLALWLMAAGAGLVAAILAVDAPSAIVHTLISLYLYLASFVLAGFVARAPERHTRLLLNAYTVAALIAATLGIVGYFGLVPDAEVLTRFDRATGAFKDPNVFGPFLVPAMVLAAHRIFTRPLPATLLPAAIFGWLGLALVVSFSRGAWLNLVIASGIYFLLALATAKTAVQRLRMIAVLVVGSIVAVGALVAALQIDDIARMFDERAAVLQPYDVGPEGRFGGQAKAVDTILDNPLGIGALNFPFNVHHEDAHNVYLSMMMNAGWLGGLVYIAIVLLTVGLGFAHALRRTPTQGLFIVAYASFAAVALEGLIIDTDHWRHFYLLLAVVWGLMTAEPQVRRARLPRRANRITGRYISPIETLAARRRPRRPARITGRARPRFPRHIAVPRRPRISPPRRPARIDYR